MKKLLAFSIAFAFLATAALPASAASNVTEAQDLLKQIKELQDKLAELNKTRSETVSELKDVLVLARDLRQGMSGDEVKSLQELLAADPDVYPEGSVTGFFGPLTAKAVMKFQQKHGIDAVGSVGPKTRAKLNELAGNKDFACKAWGRLIAPGQMKKMEGKTTIDLSECDHVPPGIMKKVEGEWHTGSSTSSTDKRAPTISYIDTDDVDADSAVITWETNEKATAIVWYSTDDDVDLDNADKEKSSTLATEHEVTLEDLEEDTDYYFVIVAKDKAGNTSTSSIEHFETEND